MSGDARGSVLSRPAVENPLTVVETREYASRLRSLLRALDREVVDTALFGEGESDLLDTEREEVDRFRELLDGRVLVPLVLDGLRGRGLALLDAFADEVESAEHGSPCGFGVAPIVEEPCS